MTHSFFKALYILGIVAFSMVFLWLTSCHSDSILDAPEIDLSLSLDTLRFDTVFTELGTVTRFVKIYNNEDDAVIVDDISLASGETGFFRINADGFEGRSIQDVRIEANDSIYIFVEATIDPDLPLSASPFIIEDKILVNANESSYTIHLEAFGQNANYILDQFSAGTVEPLPCNGSVVWNDPKPYVIYGVLAIDQCELIIEAGTKIHVHGGVAINDLGIYSDGLLIITETGSLKCMGTIDEPIHFKTDRLEPEFQEVSGQWSGILFQQGSRNNIMQHTTVQHSIVGISVDSTATVQLNSCEFSFTSGSGIAASNGIIAADNILCYENGGSSISLNHGGTYSFDHCTLGNYNNQAPALSMNNIKCYDPLCEGEKDIKPLTVDFKNCILVGNERDEVGLLDATQGEAGFFNYTLDNCIVIVDELIGSDAYPNFFDNCNDCQRLNSNDSLFVDIEMYDYHLDSLSVAIDMGVFIPEVPLDIEGNLREPSAPDLGCYEYLK